MNGRVYFIEKADGIVKIGGLNNTKQIMNDIDGEKESKRYHCNTCMIPKELWEPLKTYPSERCCELHSDFFDVIWNLEEKNQYSFDDILNNCQFFKDEYPDIKDFNATINELIEIGLDTGIISKYAS